MYNIIFFIAIVKFIICEKPDQPKQQTYIKVLEYEKVAIKSLQQEKSVIYSFCYLCNTENNS